jgi:MFS family permease
MAQVEAISRSNPVERVPVFIGAVLLSGLGALMYEISSQYSYMLGTTYGFGEGSQGDFVASFFTGYSLIAVTMVFWIRLVDWRLIAASSALAGGVGFAAMLVAQQYLLILAAMFVAGSGLGACYALSLTIFGDSDNPARAFGIKFFFDVLPGVIFNLMMPALFERYGFKGIAWANIAFCALVMATSRMLPRQGSKHPSEMKGGISLKDDGLALVACFSAFVLVLGIMALWAFLGQIGTMKGFSMQMLGRMLAVGSGLNALGALVAAWLGNRFGRIAPVAVTISINILMLVLIGATQGVTPFVIGSLVFCLTNNYTTAYTIALIADIDLRGRLIPFASACFSAGAIFGPLLSGHLLESYGLGAMLALPAITWVAAWSSFSWCYKMARKRHAIIDHPGQLVAGKLTHP